jgi:hypothetical protein
MDIALMAYIEKDSVACWIKDAVQCHCKFNNAEIGCQVSARLRNVFEQETPYVCAQFRQLTFVKLLNIVGFINLLKYIIQKQYLCLSALYKH